MKDRPAAEGARGGRGGRASASRAAALMTRAVLAHAAVVLAHGWAHMRLSIGMSPGEDAFVGLVVVAAPLLAAVLVWTPRRRLGALLLAASMFGALVFGLYHHFLDPGPDNVFGRPFRGWNALFALTALLLAAVESWGCVLGWREVRRAARA